MDRKDVGFISNILALLNTTCFGVTRFSSSWNSAVKRVRVGVLLGWVIPGKSSPGRQKQSREPVGQNGQYCVEVGGVLQVVSEPLLCHSGCGANLIEDDESLRGCL